MKVKFAAAKFSVLKPLIQVTGIVEYRKVLEIIYWLEFFIFILFVNAGLSRLVFGLLDWEML